MDKDRFQRGLEVRSEVIGKEYVQNSMSKSSDFMMPMQELVTEYCWGEIWSRPGISRKTRSLINLAVLTALNRPNELKLHTIGALNNGCTQEEIQEVFLQCAIYAGVPAAIESFKIADHVFKEGENGSN